MNRDAPSLADIASPVWREIDRRPARVENEEGVRFLIAVKSGSRAWGFPSPDSDYDIRFIHIHPRDWYLSLQPGRDVIERPIIDNIDLNGWDLRKALGLLLKSNAVISEWLESPIRYRRDDPLTQEMAALADAAFSPRRAALHYAAMAREWVRALRDSESPIPVKRYFYALRPALAIRSMRLNPGSRPPMHLHALLQSAAIAPDLARTIDELVAAKADTGRWAMRRAFSRSMRWSCPNGIA